MSIKLTILVPTVPSRLTSYYPRLMKQLLDQTRPYNNIELISFFDNKKRSIGKKRDEMLDLVQGEYAVFIDDDDRIADDYVSEIMNALQTNPGVDCVVFNCICKVDGGPPKLCKYGIEFEYGDILGGKEWRGKPAHTMVYKSSISKNHRFRDMKNCEDTDWVKRACLEIKTQFRIDKVLYHYDANYATTSETSTLTDETIEKNIRLRFGQ